MFTATVSVVRGEASAQPIPHPRVAHLGMEGAATARVDGAREVSILARRRRARIALLCLRVAAAQCLARSTSLPRHLRG